MNPVAIVDAAILALNAILSIIQAAKQSGVADDAILAQAEATTKANSVLYSTVKHALDQMK